MKLTTLIMILAIMQVSANTLAQKVSLSVRKAPLTTIFQELRQQTGYDFAYTNEELKDVKPITLNVTNKELKDVLDDIFKDQPITYTIDDKFVVISKKETFFDKVKAAFKNIDVRGKVVDENGQPLTGATISAKGGKSTSTNANGEFYLQGIDENASVIITFIGYRTVELSAKNDIGTVILESITSNLQEVKIVNKGYYEQSRLLNTGSVGSIKSTDIVKQPVGDPLLTLQGRIPGLYVEQTSGVIGAAQTVRIRGINSISNGTNPLYIVDGIPFNSSSQSQIGNAAGFANISPFNNIRPEEIESIDVLKDADATAIYGSRGANGVILITTKKGKAGKIKTEVNAYRGQSRLTNFLKLMNTQQYLEMRNEAFKNDKITPNAAQYDVNGKWSKDRFTDWQKELIGGTSSVTNANANVSGGNQYTQYLVGTSYRQDYMMFPGNYFNRSGSGNFSLSNRSENDKFKLTLQGIYTSNQYNLPQTDFTSLIFMAPNAPAVYNLDGSINWENNTFNNPFRNTLRTSKINSDALITNLGLSYQILKGLTFKSSLGYSVSNFTETNLTPLTSYRPSEVFNPTLSRQNTTGISSAKTWQIEPQVSYNKTIGNHSLEILVGSTFQKVSNLANYINATGFTSDILLESPQAATTIVASSTTSEYKYNALFTRIGYNYKEKYILNLTGRRDGSSRFGSGKQFGNFGAIGAAWVFSREDLIEKKFPFLSLGKIRGSVGITGNDQISDYQFLDTYGTVEEGYLGVSPLYPDKLSNPDFKWETIDKKEVAIELGFNNNKIIINAAYFRNNTRNQLVGYNLSSVTGFSTVIANLPANILNSGYELDLTTQNINRKLFKWSTTANITIPRSKLVSFPGILGTSYATTYGVGQSLNSRLRYQYTGVDSKTGRYIVADINKDGSYNLLTDGYWVFVGQQYYGGINNSFSYKGLSLDVFFQFVKQSGYKNGTAGVPGRFLGDGVTANVPVEYLDRWQQPGDNKTFASYSTRNPADYIRYISSDDRVVDASFVRLKNVSLAYSLPSFITNKWNFRTIKVFFQGQNLMTFTGFKGLNPEGTSPNSTPSLAPFRTMTIGLDVSL